MVKYIYKIKIRELHSGAHEYTPIVKEIKYFAFIPYSIKSNYILEKGEFDIELSSFAYPCYTTKQEAIAVIERHINHRLKLPKSIIYEDYNNG